MNKFLLIIALLILTNISAFANQGDQVITLKDGSQIKGHLSGIENGIYTVKTPIIGDVHVAASDVASINNGDQVDSSGKSTPSVEQQIAVQQQKLMSNPKAMAELQQMAQDPDITKALSDPALVQAVTNHDYQAVENNSNVQELMNTPKMKSFLQKLAAVQQQNTSSQ